MQGKRACLMSGRAGADAQRSCSNWCKVPRPAPCASPHSASAARSLECDGLVGLGVQQASQEAPDGAPVGPASRGGKGMAPCVSVAATAW